MKNASIVRDIIRQGKDFMESKRLKILDLTSDKLIMLCENDSFNDRTYVNTYYDNEDYIHEVLETWYYNNLGRCL